MVVETGSLMLHFFSRAALPILPCTPPTVRAGMGVQSGMLEMAALHSASGTPGVDGRSDLARPCTLVVCGERPCVEMMTLLPNSGVQYVPNQLRAAHAEHETLSVGHPK